MLAAQILKNQEGIPMGVFIPMQVWENVKRQYPDIEEFDTDIPQWEKDFIDSRLEMIQHHPERLKPIETLFEMF
jgi:hypothetical protein